MDERFTPPEVFGPLDRLFGFTLDPCTTADNPLAVNVFWTKEDDGLSRDWSRQHVFVNPPYSQMLRWAKKAIYATMDGAFVAFLIPNDCSTEAFRLLAANSWGRWEIPFRVKFRTPTVEKKDVARSHVVFFLGGLK